MTAIYFGDPEQSAIYDAAIHGDFDILSATIYYLQKEPMVATDVMPATGIDDEGWVYFLSWPESNSKPAPSLDELLNCYAELSAAEPDPDADDSELLPLVQQIHAIVSDLGNGSDPVSTTSTEEIKAAIAQLKDDIQVAKQEGEDLSSLRSEIADLKAQRKQVGEALGNSRKPSVTLQPIAVGLDDLLAAIESGTDDVVDRLLQLQIDLDAELDALQGQLDSITALVPDVAEDEEPSTFEAQTSTKLSEVVAKLDNLERGILSTDPNDGFLSVMEQLGGITEAVGDVGASVGDAMTRLDAIPETPELGEFTEVDVLAAGVTRFGGATISSGGIRDGNDWASGFYSSLAIQHPGEYFEFVVSGHGVFGLMDPSKFDGFSTPSNMFFLGNASVFFNPSKASGVYDAICRNIGALRDLQSQSGQAIRITLVETAEERGITWNVVSGDLVTPQVFYPISIPKAGLAPWGIFGGNSRVSQMRLGKFEQVS